MHVNTYECFERFPNLKMGAINDKNINVWRNAMSAFMQKPNQVERKWYIIDAAGRNQMGRVAAQATILLRGNTNQLIHHMLTVAIVFIIINCADAV